MKRASVLAVACAMLGGFATTSTAGAYNSPKQAKTHHVEMVTAFNQCLPGAANLTHRPSLALPACAPAATSANNPANVLSFSMAGAMTIEFKSQTGNFTVKVTSRGIFNNGGPYTGNLTATMNLRASDNGCGASPYDEDCTRSDFPLPITLNCTNSFCLSAAPNANAVLPGVANAGEKTNIEFGQVSVNDPDGDTFARGGLFIR